MRTFSREFWSNSATTIAGHRLPERRRSMLSEPTRDPHQVCHACDVLALRLLGRSRDHQCVRRQEVFNAAAQQLSQDTRRHRLRLDRGPDVQCATVRVLPRFAREVVFGDLLFGYPQTMEMEGQTRPKVPPQFALEVDVNQYAGWVVVTDVEDADPFARRG